MAPSEKEIPPPTAPHKNLFLSLDIIHWEHPPATSTLIDLFKRISLPGLHFGAMHIPPDFAWVAIQYVTDPATGKLVPASAALEDTRTEEEKEEDEKRANDPKVDHVAAKMRRREKEPSLDPFVRKVFVKVWVELSHLKDVVGGLPGAIWEEEEGRGREVFGEQFFVPLVRLVSGMGRGDEVLAVLHRPVRPVGLGGVDGGIGEGDEEEDGKSVEMNGKNGAWSRYLALLKEQDGEGEGNPWAQTAGGEKLREQNQNVSKKVAVDRPEGWVLDLRQYVEQQALKEQDIAQSIEHEQQDIQEFIEQPIEEDMVDSIEGPLEESIQRYNSQNLIQQQPIAPQQPTTTNQDPQETTQSIFEPPVINLGSVPLPARQSEAAIPVHDILLSDHENEE